MLLSKTQYLVWCGDDWKNYNKIKIGGKAKRKGGLGDRLRGMIATKSLARVLGLKFSMIWEENMLDKLFEYPSYNDLDIKKDDIGVYSMLNSPELPILLSKEKPENIFTNKINKVLNNRPSWKFVLKNPHLNNVSTDNNIDLEEFSQLYTHILVPKPKMLSTVSKIIKGQKNIIGIQLRTGDKNMGVGKGVRDGLTLDSDSRILRMFKNIKKHLQVTYNDNYSIFLTSDYPNILKLGVEVWSQEQVLYYNKRITHIDKTRDKNSTDKTFIDNYILSQKTEIIYASLSSGFSKIACLSSSHDNFYNIISFDTSKNDQQLLNIPKSNKKILIEWKKKVV